MPPFQKKRRKRKKQNKKRIMSTQRKALVSYRVQGSHKTSHDVNVFSVRQINQAGNRKKIPQSKNEGEGL
jgi:hypothetical protein